MELYEIVAFLFLMIAADHYFFGMQRVLLEAGRIVNCKLDFLLPGWFGVSSVVTIAKYVLVIWAIVESTGFGLFLLIFTFLFSTIFPTPRKVYGDLFLDKMDEMGIQGDDKKSIIIILSNVGVYDTKDIPDK